MYSKGYNMRTKAVFKKVADKRFSMLSSPQFYSFVVISWSLRMVE